MLKLSTQTLTAIAAAAVVAGSLAASSAPASAAPMNIAPAMNGAQTGMTDADAKVVKIRHRRGRRHGHRHRRHRHWHGGWISFDPFYYGYGGYRTCRFVKFKKWSPRRGRFVWRTKKRCFFPSY